jgi:hypothetical protein
MLVVPSLVGTTVTAGLRDLLSRPTLYSVVSHYFPISFGNSGEVTRLSKQSIYKRLEIIIASHVLKVGSIEFA